jgi:hypothetical protein
MLRSACSDASGVGADAARVLPGTSGACGDAARHDARAADAAEVGHHLDAQVRRPGSPDQEVHPRA